MYKAKIKADINRMDELLSVEPIETKDVIRLVRLRLHLIQYLHTMYPECEDEDTI